VRALFAELDPLSCQHERALPADEVSVVGKPPAATARQRVLLAEASGRTTRRDHSCRGTTERQREAARGLWIAEQRRQMIIGALVEADSTALGSRTESSQLDHVTKHGPG
jgi:hypothetical protein